jgi:transcriptional regulator with XRE-family HTH domain
MTHLLIGCRVVAATDWAAVRRLRTSWGWSLEELADRVGIHRTYIGDVERGRRNIGLINVGRIAAALEVSLVTLICEVGEVREVGERN